MVYLNESHIEALGFDWAESIATVRHSVECMASSDFAQPIKPYLRYKEEINRIIAMPAFVGGDINKAGIKWIASFPKNINNGLPRAHSVIVLNDADTGVPSGILNSGAISAIRTAAVSGLVMDLFLKVRKPTNAKVGLIGYGPIGQHHLHMCHEVLKGDYDEIRIFDLKKIDKQNIPAHIRDKVSVVDTWQEAYQDADIFMTCTVSDAPYIDAKPKTGSLHLNASLRDYKTDVYDWFAEAIIVDNWEEICRENTDVENFHLEKGLQKGDTMSILDILAPGVFESFGKDQAVMFNPMGMAVFDIAIAESYIKKATQSKVGHFLN